MSVIEVCMGSEYHQNWFRDEVQEIFRSLVKSNPVGLSADDLNTGKQTMVLSENSR
jgi:hypothetical protein